MKIEICQVEEDKNVATMNNALETQIKKEQYANDKGHNREQYNNQDKEQETTTGKKNIKNNDGRRND